MDATTQNPPKCLQLSRDLPSQLQNAEKVFGQEDCLTLNVYTPLQGFSYVSEQMFCFDVRSKLKSRVQYTYSSVNINESKLLHKTEVT